ncbi:hypothetical protein ACA910_007896 [Epithemia clementina (nom. ined.)]
MNGFTLNYTTLLLWLSIVVVVVRSLTTTTPSRSFFSRQKSLLIHQENKQAKQQGCFTSCSELKATVEEDLEDALDSLLLNAIGEAEEKKDKATKFRIKQKSQDVARQDNYKKVDWSDQAMLSISNPHWVEAGLSPSVIDVLSSKGITIFTPVQGEAFHPILEGRDVIGRSRTGTGKTLAFGLPALTRLVGITKQKGTRDEQGRMLRGRKVSMIVLCPTRELARQVSEELFSIARPLGLFVDVFHGGVAYEPQSRALKNGIDVLVGTPGRVMDHMDRGNLDLGECNIVVLDEADEMLNMGFAEDVEVIMEDIGAKNAEKTQCLLFSATTPQWVKQIGAQYQEDVVSIDSTSEEGGARVAKNVRHLAVQLPPGVASKRSVLEDIIAVEISKDAGKKAPPVDNTNAIAAAAAEKKAKSNGAMQQKIFGKTIVFTETKREADELVSGGVFKSLTAQALHGDVGQKQRDSILNAFRCGAFNVLVATDVAARGIDIQDVDLVVQFDPPRDVDTYVHRSGRTGRAGRSGVSVLLFSPQQAKDIVRIERDLGHGFQFDLVGPPSTEAALKAAAKTSSIASQLIPDETAAYFKDAAAELLHGSDNPEDVVARCLAAISRRAADVQSRSLITGEPGMATVEMVTKGRPVSPGDVMFTVSKLSRMSKTDEDLAFDGDVGKIQTNQETGSAIFDMSVDDAKKLVEISKDVDVGGAAFSLLQELEVLRGRHFGKPLGRGSRPDQGSRRDGDRRSFGGDRRSGNQRQPIRSSGKPVFGDTRTRGSRFSNNYHAQSLRPNHNDEKRGGNVGPSGYRGRYDGRGPQPQRRYPTGENDSW